ncbi:hypothetical protein INR49_007277, partial [Caranx melampygus]
METRDQVKDTREQMEDDRLIWSVLTCKIGVSLKSDRSRILPPDLSGAEVPPDERVQPAAAASSCPSGVSLKSDRSRILPPDLSGAEVPPDERWTHSGASTDQTASSQSLNQKDFEDKVSEFMKSNMMRVWNVLSSSGECEEGKEKEEEVDEELIQSETGAKEGFLQIVLHVLKTMKQDAYVSLLQQ